MGLRAVTQLECTLCGRTYSMDEVTYTCPDHGPAQGILEVDYDYGVIRDEFDAPVPGPIDSQWKYRALLPVADEAAAVTIEEGGTDLIEAPNLGATLGIDLSIKDDGRNPTGCLKDRASSIAVTKAAHAGEDVVTCASTGNAAASLAGYAARAGLDCRIFVPHDAPREKLAQPLVYGADVLAVDGTYDEAYDLSLAATDDLGWYNRNAAINPYQIEGKRTVGFELAEQTAGGVPDWLVVSMGDGCTIAGAWKGFDEFSRLGFVEETPKLLGVQAAGASAIHDAFHGHDSVDDVVETVADSIAVGRPRNTIKACRALEASGGTALTVTDEDILAAEVILGSHEGLYTEPAGATAIAGIRRARDEGIIEAGERVVAISTGYGLKDAESALAATDDVTRIEPDLEAVRAHYAG